MTNKSDKIQQIKDLMTENDISLDDIHKASLDENHPISITAWVGATMILASCFFLPAHLKFGNLRFYVPFVISIVLTYGLLFIYNRPSFSRFFNIVNILSSAIFLFGLNYYFSEYGAQTNSIVLGTLLSSMLLVHQYALFKVKNSEPGIWIILFFLGMLSINIQSLLFNYDIDVLLTVSSLFTLLATYALSRLYHIKSLPLLYFISTIVLAVFSSICMFELAKTPEISLVTPAALFIISKLFKSKTILFTSCISLLISILTIFGKRLTDTSMVIMVAGSCLIIGIFFLIFGLRSSGKEKE